VTGENAATVARTDELSSRYLIAFAADLADAIADLAARYHDEHTPNGRWHRVVVAAHPRPAHNKL
jgi:hypothetical protein